MGVTKLARICGNRLNTKYSLRNSKRKEQKEGDLKNLEAKPEEGRSPAICRSEKHMCKTVNTKAGIVLQGADK